MRADQRVERHSHEELQVELADDFERFADALDGFTPIAHQGGDRCCVGAASSCVTSRCMARSWAET